MFVLLAHVCQWQVLHSGAFYRTRRNKSELPRSPDRFRWLVLHCHICKFQEPTSAFGIDVAGSWGGWIPSAASGWRRRRRCKWHDVVRGSCDNGNWSCGCTSLTGRTQRRQRWPWRCVVASSSVGQQSHLNWQRWHLVHIIETMSQVGH